MATEISIDKDRKIIQRTATGDLSTERTLKLVQELAFLASIHKDYHILADIRETEAKPEMLDLMQIASTCAKLRSDFKNRIALLIPNREERVRFAQLLKSCMETQGFEFMHFVDHESATAWLSK